LNAYLSIYNKTGRQHEYRKNLHHPLSAADIAHVSRIGRVGHEQVKKTTRPWAEKFGITEVTWAPPK
jgi:hypothetical protein